MIRRIESNSQRQEILKIKIFKILRSASLSLLQVALSIPLDMSPGYAEKHLYTFFWFSDYFYFCGLKITSPKLKVLWLSIQKNYQLMYEWVHFQMQVLVGRLRDFWLRQVPYLIKIVNLLFSKNLILILGMCSVIWVLSQGANTSHNLNRLILEK